MYGMQHHWADTRSVERISCYYYQANFLPSFRNEAMCREKRAIKSIDALSEFSLVRSTHL